MSTCFRSVFGTLLCLLLALTSQSMAVARGATMAAGQMVICVGSDTQTIYVDAEGQPTEAPHICAECTLTLIDADVPFLRSCQDNYLTAHGSILSEERIVKPEKLTGFLTRAPPEFV